MIAHVGGWPVEEALPALPWLLLYLRLRRGGGR